MRCICYGLVPVCNGITGNGNAFLVWPSSGVLHDQAGSQRQALTRTGSVKLHKQPSSRLLCSAASQLLGLLCVYTEPFRTEPSTA